MAVLNNPNSLMNRSRSLAEKKYDDTATLYQQKKPQKDLAKKPAVKG
jgi:hypothetical protein